MRNENQGSKNRERKQREDENPLASTKKLHQRRLPTVDPVAKSLRKTIKTKFKLVDDGGRTESNGLLQEYGISKEGGKKEEWV